MGLNAWCATARVRRRSYADRRTLAWIGVLFAGFWMAACAERELRPLEIAEGDVCSLCRAPIAEKQYAAELITKDGFVRKFDDIGCMLEHSKKKVKAPNIGAHYVADYGTKEWLNAAQATFVRSDKFKTPANSGILAFKDRGKAQALASGYQAQMVSLSDLLK